MADRRGGAARPAVPFAARRALLLSLMMSATWRYAGAAERKRALRAVVGDDSQATRIALDALRRRIDGFDTISVEQLPAARSSQSVLLTIGPAALRAVLAMRSDDPVLSLFASSHAYAGALKGSDRHAATAIYADTSPEHQLRLIAALFQRPVTVGVLLTDATASLAPQLARAARAFELELLALRALPQANVVRELNRVGSADVLLALPDPLLFTVDTIRSILESTYRRGQPVVGFSQGMVAAGALASAHSTPDDVASHAAGLLADIEAGRLPASSHPAYWRVAVNDSVARSLNIVVPDEARALGHRPTPGTR